jgi:hypothetical protein
MSLKGKTDHQDLPDKARWNSLIPAENAAENLHREMDLNMEQTGTRSLMIGDMPSVHEEGLSML